MFLFVYRGLPNRVPFFILSLLTTTYERDVWPSLLKLFLQFSQSRLYSLHRLCIEERFTPRILAISF